MKMYLKYIRSVSRHKWFVFLECCKEGIPLRGLLHDMSKFLPSEFFPYARFFNGDRRNKPAYYKPYGTGDDAFDFAWLRHQKRNQHHWQWWVLPEDDGGTKVMPMSDIFRLEMWCDWRGAGKAYNNGNTVEWYDNNKGNMQLHPETRAWIESKVDELR